MRNCHGCYWRTNHYCLLAIKKLLNRWRIKQQYYISLDNYITKLDDCEYDTRSRQAVYNPYLPLTDCFAVIGCLMGFHQKVGD